MAERRSPLKRRSTIRPLGGVGRGKVKRIAVGEPVANVLNTPHVTSEEVSSLLDSFPARSPVEYAGFGRRTIALLVDVGVLMALNWPLRILMRLATTPVVYMVLSNVWWCFHVTFQIAPVAIWGKTPGKYLAGVRVVSLDLSRASWSQAVWRDLVALLSGVWFQVALTGVLLAMSQATYDKIAPGEMDKYLAQGIAGMNTWAFLIMGLWGLSEPIVLLLNEKKRALHDYIAGTVVVVDKAR